MGATDSEKDCLLVTVGHRERGSDPRQPRFGRGHLVSVRRGRRGFASVRCDCCSSLLRVMVHGSRYDRSMGEPRGAEFLRVTAFVWLGLIGGIIPMMTDAGVFLATVFAAAGVIIGLFFMPKDQVPERYPIAYVIGGAKPLKHVVRGAYVPISEPVSP